MKPIVIQSSRIVLRGAGSAQGGTLIRADHSGDQTGPYPAPKKGKDFTDVPYIFAFQSPGNQSTDGEADGAAETIKTPPSHRRVLAEIKRAALLLPVSSTNGLKAGDWISLQAKSRALSAELLAGLGPACSRISG